MNTRYEQLLDLLEEALGLIPMQYNGVELDENITWGIRTRHLLEQIENENVRKT